MRKTADIFRTVIDEKFHQQLVARGDRRMSHRALLGALMIMLYREQLRFQVCFLFEKKNSKTKSYSLGSLSNFIIINGY